MMPWSRCTARRRCHHVSVSVGWRVDDEQQPEEDDDGDLLGGESAHASPGVDRRVSWSVATRSANASAPLARTLQARQPLAASLAAR
jgi:hypothetical protein